jgi:indole-3-glycerol phosphate synthase
VFRPDFDPVRIATAYERGGAAALSVLTDERFFQGSLSDLEGARAAVSIPALRKDFTNDEYHLVEAAAHGADCILLIAAILTETQLTRYRELASEYRMDAIVEVHDDSELERAIGSGAEIIGVNNRNLHTFQVTLDTSLRLAERIPAGVLKISESGIETRADIEKLQSAGYGAFLIGESLMRSDDAAQALRDLC